MFLNASSFFTKDLLGVELVSSKEDKKETVLNSPTLESAKKKKKKSLEKATISPEKNAKPSETEQGLVHFQNLFFF